MLETIALIAMLQGVQTQSQGIQCLFPASDTGGKPLQVVLDPMPSLKDQPGLYRVIMEIEGQVTLKAAAQPITSTADRDIMILAKSAHADVFTLGMREDGAAALTMRKAGYQADSAQNTRIGACDGAEPHINRWLPL